MNQKLIKRVIFTTLLIGMLITLNSCSISGASGSSAIDQLFKPTIPTLTPTETSTPTAIPATSTPTSTETPLPTLTPTPAIITVNAGENVTVPILLYHHISEDNSGNRYYVSPEVFETQMKWLYDHHYQTITVSQLADVIIHGGTLPERAVIITFDDGDQDVFLNAFPVMQKFGFVGTAYIIVNWIGAPGFDTPDQINQLISAGWEIGSHSMSHIDLTKNEDKLEDEVRNSLVQLNSEFGIKVSSLAYPFGLLDHTVYLFTTNSGYTNAVGLGVNANQGLFNLYNLSRMEIRQEYSMDQFIALLPWQD
ncbi:MAG: polysaccharide deacetylase family protein [Anaerolineaceae bacterium]